MKHIAPLQTAVFVSLVGLVAALSPLALSGGGGQLGARVDSQNVTVRAVLFFSPTCPHCQTVLQEQLPDIFRAFGGRRHLRVDENLSSLEHVFYVWGNDQLEIVLVDASQARGAELYEASTASHHVAPDRLGVPRLVVGKTVLVGAIEIPARFPGLIRRAFANGGQDWPSTPGVLEAVALVVAASAASEIRTS